MLTDDEEFANSDRTLWFSHSDDEISYCIFLFFFFPFFFCNGTKFELSLLFKFVTFNFNFSLFTQSLYFYSGLRILICLRKIYAFIADCEFLCLRGNIFDNSYNISVSNFVTYLTIYVTQGNIKDTK